MNPLISIVTGVLGLAVGATVSYIVTKNKYERQASEMVAAVREQYEPRKTDDEEADEPTLPVQDSKPDIFTAFNPNAVQYARSINEGAGYVSATKEELENSDPTLPKIISEEEFAADNCESMILHYYPQCDKLLMAEGDEAGTEVVFRSFAVGENNLTKLKLKQNEYIIVHNPSQNINYEIWAYEGVPNLDKYVNASLFPSEEGE
jgi:hypothetical protein